MPEIAFVTHAGSPEVNDDDQLAAEILRRHGVSVSACVWDAPGVDWTQWKCVVIRSAWDYHLKPLQYTEWLRSFSSLDGRLWNPPPIVLENLNKNYLTALATRGVDIVPTVCVPTADGVVLHDVMTLHGWSQSVIKPAVSACAGGTWRTSLSTANANQDRFAEQNRQQELLIQPYMPEIATQGEWSLIFFDGQYSHAALKRPAPGDFRVQREFGGHSVPADPSARLIEQAQAVLAVVDSELLYARVDGIDCNGQLLLVELEVNEPLLFLGYSPGAPQRFADAILRRL